MSVTVIESNWALLAGSLLAIFVLAFVAFTLFRNSSSGQLRRVRAELKVALRGFDKAQSAGKKALKRVQKLDAKTSSTKPRLLTEAKELLEDSRALEKIAQDKVLVARNHVRRVIHEEFPPKKHAKMRARYLPGDTQDDKPFSF